MKTLRKVLSFAVSLMMVFSLMTVVSADTEPTATISVKASDTHTYEVYQIMTGDVSGTTLSNAKWGANANGQTVGTSVEDTALTTISTKTSASDLASYVNFNSTPVATVKARTSATVSTGYYLLKDIGYKDTNGNTVITGDSYSLYILKVVNNVTIVPKKGEPTVEKKVYEEEKGWQDAADYDIGDHVPFKLTATLGDMSMYSTYFVQFDDTFDAGLTYDSNAQVWVVKAGTTPTFTQVINEDGIVSYTATGATEAPTDVFTVSTGTKDGKAQVFVTTNNVKAIDGISEGDQIVVTYTATLNTNAVIGTPGNFNEIKLEYSNNPNDTQDGTPSKGETPTDKVVVFTYKLVVNKTDGTDPLTGAEFTLTKQGSTTPIAVVKNEAGTEFTFKGLDAGIYVLTETTTPVGYNTIAPITITVTASYDEKAENPELKTLTVDPATFTADLTTGTITGNVVNNAGSTLPETGGMGTTMLYVGGSLLMLGAAILLVSKKRMSTVK